MPLSWIAAPRLVVNAGRAGAAGHAAGGHAVLQHRRRRAGARRAASSRSSARAAIPTCCAAPSTPATAFRWRRRTLAPKGSRLLPETLLAPLPDVTLGLYARDGGGAAAREPLLRHMIDSCKPRRRWRRPDQPQNARAFAVQAPTPLSTMCAMTAQT